ncbi:MAG TPA: cobalt ECF transporter T component CbiQ [Geobacteraceae bacterium]|nr:cobalt ECF transporter T component CbiQ [Geobacteraceae bacterium]
MHQLNRQTTNSEHPLTRLDPRVKLICVLVLLIMVISGRGLVFPSVMAMVSIGLCLDLGVRPKVLLMRFAEPIFIAVMVLLLKLFFSGATPLFSFNVFALELTGHRDGLLQGLLIASRIGGSVSLVALLGFCTSFTDLMGALTWLRAPRGFIEVALFAWRYLFVLFDDAQVVYSAQKNRLGYSGIFRGLRSFGTLTGALVIKAFDNSQTITTAMAQRGYDGTMPLLRQRPLRGIELALSFAFLVCMGIIWRF